MKNKRKYHLNQNFKKKLVCFSYLLALLLVLGFVMIEDPVKTNNYDFILSKLSQILALFSLLIPFLVFISSKIKMHLPFIKKKKWWASIFGYFLIFGLLLSSSIITDSIHTEEYKIKYQEYLNVEKTKESASISENELTKELEDLTNEDFNKSESSKILDSLLKVHYFDVGQGDSIFIELPNNKTMLIDAGEKDQADKIINEIRSLGYTKINYIIGTHPHTDHIGGLAKIIQNFDIDSIFMPKVVSTSKTYENLLKTILSKGLKVTPAKSGVTIVNQDDFQMSFIAPNSDSYSNLNNYSAVLKIKYKNRTFLFMGDAEVESEEEITDPSADVIKIGHHGSDTSSKESFIKKVNPKYVIISVGKDNPYKHPNEAILNCWQENGAEIFRTDIDGNITITTNGEKLFITSEHGKNNGDFNLLSTPKMTQDNTINNSLNNKEQVMANEEKGNITLVSFMDKVKRGQNATINIQGIPNHNYKITVVYTSVSKAKGLEEKTSDQLGNVSWTWKIGTNTKPGTYRVTISDENNREDYSFTVE